jgi:hypothetical protein
VQEGLSVRGREKEVVIASEKHARAFGSWRWVFGVFFIPIKEKQNFGASKFGTGPFQTKIGMWLRPQKLKNPILVPTSTVGFLE